jgi:16S rRNA (guanine(966)-N(2))-methyltransferase RsmD
MKHGKERPGNGSGRAPQEESRIRIGGGDLRTRKIRAPEGDTTRPVLARIKKSVFDTLGGKLEGAQVLDLFSGAGTLGLEALSRGASSVVLVERGNQALAAIRDNINALGAGDRAKVVAGDAFSLPEGLGAESGGFDIMFIDPPFAEMRDRELLEVAGRLLGPSGTAVLRVPADRALVARHAGMVLAREKRYGVSRVGFYRRGSPAMGEAS